MKRYAQMQILTTEIKCFSTQLFINDKRYSFKYYMDLSKIIFGYKANKQ